MTRPYHLEKTSYKQPLGTRPGTLGAARPMMISVVGEVDALIHAEYDVQC